VEVTRYLKTAVDEYVEMKREGGWSIWNQLKMTNDRSEAKRSKRRIPLQEVAKFQRIEREAKK
jgi:hypothetical protein